MPEKVFLLTHDFKPAFRKTLMDLEAHDGGLYDSEVLLDDRKEIPSDLDLGRVKVTKCKRHHSDFDPIGQAHNFYLDIIRSDMSILDRHERFWVFENDAYFHGNIVEFMSEHEPFDTDLLVPEFGHRHPGWCWIHSARGIRPGPMGVTAVAYRASSRLMRELIARLDSGVSAHMELILPHICLESGMKVLQFIPDLVGCFNTFATPMSEIIEAEVRSGNHRLIQRKLYHPVKA